MDSHRATIPILRADQQDANPGDVTTSPRLGSAGRESLCTMYCPSETMTIGMQATVAHYANQLPLSHVFACR